MKRFAVLFAAVVLAWSILPAQEVDEGYVFLKDVQSYSKKSLKSKKMSTITAGRVIVKGEGNEYSFGFVDVAEYFTLGSGSFYKYYPPAQDIVPAEYVSAAAFKKAVRKVSISQALPADILPGRVYTFVPSAHSDYVASLKIRALRLPDNVTLATDVDYDNNWQPTNVIDISGETVLELEYAETVAYWYNGQVLMLARNLGGEDYCTLEIDNDGVIYAKDANGNRVRDSRLSYVFGEMPEVGYFGWISANEVVLDDMLCVAANR